MSDERREDTHAYDYRAAAWDAFARGELPPEDEAMLRALSETDEDHEEHLAAYTPLDDAFRARIAAQLGESLERTTRPSRRRVLQSSAAVVLTAMAASFVLIARRPEPLPEYSLRVSGAVQATRGATAKDVPLAFTPDSQLSFVLTPEVPVSEQVELRVLLSHDGDTRAWQVPVERAARGALRVGGPARELLGQAYGDYRARFELTRPSGGALQTVEATFTYRAAASP